MTQKKRIGTNNAAGGRAKAGSPIQANRAYLRYAANNPNLSMAGAGVLRVPGQSRDAGRYGERLREDRKYPNRRRRIITGKELTTPLGRKRAIEKARRERARTRAKETVSIKVKTVAAESKRFPANAIFGFVVVTLFLLSLIWSQIKINEQNNEISGWSDKISAESKKEKNLKNELENKDDFGFYMDYAVNELGMVKEESNSIQKKYISGKSGDKAEVVETNGSRFMDLPNIMSAIFKK